MFDLAVASKPYSNNMGPYRTPPMMKSCTAYYCYCYSIGLTLHGAVVKPRSGLKSRSVYSELCLKNFRLMVQSDLPVIEPISQVIIHHQTTTNTLLAL